MISMKMIPVALLLMKVCKITKKKLNKLDESITKGLEYSQIMKGSILKGMQIKKDQTYLGM